MVRAIAARQLHLIEQEKQAFDEWSNKKGSGDVDDLSSYIGSEIEDYFRLRKASK
jgi:hypothetical protein